MRKNLFIFFFLISLFIHANVAYAYHIRIGLQTGVPNTIIGSQDEAVVVDARKNKPLVKLNAMRKYSIYNCGGEICIKKHSEEKIFETNTDVIFVMPAKDNTFLFAKGHWYRGSFKIKTRRSAITLINVIDIEEYIKSVVPSEMPASWSLEALKAQAIAARSYALANINKRSAEGYDLKDTPQDQAYKGAIAENYKSSNAVSQTKGQVLVSNNKIIPAYYHSSSGGITDNSVWNSQIDYVKPVKDFDQASPKSYWSKSYNKYNVSCQLSSSGFDVGTLTGVFPIQKTPFGRVKSLKIMGTKGSKIIDVETFQDILNLPSNLFNIFISGNVLSVNGKGCGHGVGMSQWGAKAMAEKGCNVYQILGYYFTNVQVTRIADRSN